MSLWLGARLAVAGGRESLVRIALTATGVAVGVTLLLIGLLVVPAMQGRIDRYAWHRTDAAAPATATDPALWLPSTDRYDGRDIVRFHVAAQGQDPPVPPGLDRLPAPGEVVVSPALADLLRTVPDDQLRDRFPGRIAGTIGPAGLVSPDELVAVVGRTPQELAGTAGAYQIRGIERPGDPLDLKSLLYAGLVMVGILLVGPILVFVSTVTRINAARRERRFAAIRLAGATRGQTGVMAATETGLAAIAGTLLGWGAYALIRPKLIDSITYEGLRFPAADLQAPGLAVALVLIGVPVVTIGTTLVVLRRAQISPLGTQRQARIIPPSAWRLVPLVLGVLGIAETVRRSADPAYTDNEAFPTIRALSLVCTLAGFVLAGPWACMWLARGWARISRRGTSLMAARRMAADPYTAFRAISGVAIAAFVATMLASIAIDTRTAEAETASVLDAGVVAVNVRGTPASSVAPLVTPDAVVTRIRPNGVVVVPCAELARLTNLSCPLTLSIVDNGPPKGLSVTAGFAEPRPGDETLPLHVILVPTDGSTAAQERVRTLAAVAAPYSLARTNEDSAAQSSARSAEGVDATFRLAMAFVLFVAACSLTVSVIGGLIERRRPFALLRASGVRLAELRSIALQETAAPLLLTTAAGVGVGLLVSHLALKEGDWVVPDPAFFAAVGIGALVALGVSMLTWPLMDVVTRQDAVRFE